MSEELKPCGNCGGKCDPTGWMAGDGRQGPECEGCGITTPDVESWNRLMATLPQPAAVEAVEVVAVTNRGVCYWQAQHLLDLLPNGTQLMTVAQHNRIMAATVPAGCKVVKVELLELIDEAMCDFLGEDDPLREQLHAILEVKP